MAQQILGGLTTLNLSTNLDPMFTELYAAAGGNFTSVTTFTVGNGAAGATKSVILNGGSTSGFGSYLAFQRGGGNALRIGDAGGILGGAEGADTVVYTYGAFSQRFYTNGAERMRIDAAGNVGIGSSSIPSLGGTGPILDMYNGTTQPAITFHNSVSGQVANRGGMIRMTAANLDFTNFEATGLINLSTNSITRLIVNASGGVLPGADNTQPLGGGSARWSVVYAGTGTINTSDAREKTAVEELAALEIAASIALGKEIGGFKFLSAIKEKGSSDARFHIGMTVQRAMEVMKDHGLDPLAYAFICHDEWAESTTQEETDEDGNITREAVTTPAGDRYGFRVDELSLFIMRGLVARLDAMEA